MLKVNNKKKNLAISRKVRGKYNSQQREKESGKKQQKTLAEAQLQIEVTKERERRGGTVGTLSGRVDTASCIGHSTWLTFKRNYYLILSEKKTEGDSSGKLFWED